MSEAGFASIHRPPPGLIGRDREFATALRALWRGRTVLLVGRRGLGTSRLAREVAEELASEGGRPVLAAVAPAVRAPVGSAITLVYDLPTLSSAVQHGVDAGTPVTVLLDADTTLSESTIEWLIGEASAGRTTLIAPLGSPAGTLPAPAFQRSLLSLWRTGRADRIDLGPLERESAEQLVSVVLGERALDTPTRMRLVRDGAGMPLLLGELTRQVLEQGNDGGLESRLFRPAEAPSARILDLIGPLLEDLDPAELDALVALARLDGLPAAHLRRYLTTPGVEELFARGLASADRSDRRVYVHRISAEAALLHGGSAAPGPLDAMIEDLRAGGRPDAQEYVYLADHLLESGASGLSSDQAVEILIGAAEVSLASGSPDRALAFARAASGVVDGAADPLVQRAGRALDGHLDPPGLAPALTQAVHDMRWADIVESAQAELATERDPLRRLALLGPLELAAAVLGRSAVLLDGLQLGRALVPHLLSSSDAVQVTAASAATAEYLSYAAFAKVLTGVGWEELQSNADLATLWLLGRNYASHLPLMAAANGLLAYGRGEFGQAEAEFRGALDAGHPCWAPFSRTWLVTSAGRASLQQGKIDEARFRVALARAERAEFSLWDEYALLQAEADLALALGEQEHAVEVLLRQARACSGRSPLLAVVMAYEAVRAGATGEEPRRLLETNADLVEFEAIRSMASAALGWLLGDGRVVTRELRATLSRGYGLLAGQMVVRQGGEGPARRAGADGEPAVGDVLTPREREIAVLAGEGSTNAEIAARLFLSVRTVESHLYSARLKTGAASRQELGEVAMWWGTTGTGDSRG